MNNKIVSVVALLSLTAGVAGCDGEKTLNMAQVHQLEDSVAKEIPSIATIQTKVVDNSNLKVIIGDVKFYTASPEQKQQAAVRVGQMALQIFGADNRLVKGTLVVTKDLRNNDEVPADGVSTDMKIDSLKKTPKP